jgi:CheY-like chemotaxis protein
MFTSDELWKTVDLLALRHGLSPSAIAIRAGLDPTTLNKSKRLGLDGQPRWLSTETLSKILGATRTSLEDFADIVAATRPHGEEVQRSATKAHILLVESDAALAARATAELSEAGYFVEAAPDLRRALAVIESGTRLDLLITEIDLPSGGHGRTLAQIALSYHSELKILLIADSVQFRAAGTSLETTLRKPLKNGRLKEAATRLLTASRLAGIMLDGPGTGHGGNGKAPHSDRP